mmetsp:Transcript_98893/g.235898  ORF Transcript_98893/g.235898 Transcript_98893/m.235898 type:complete len:204 (-) Transcript_98893:691-1302(-)
MRPWKVLLDDKAGPFSSETSSLQNSHCSFQAFDAGPKPPSGAVDAMVFGFLWVSHQVANAATYNPQSSSQRCGVCLAVAFPELFQCLDDGVGGLAVCGNSGTCFRRGRCRRCWWLFHRRRHCHRWNCRRGLRLHLHAGAHLRSQIAQRHSRSHGNVFELLVIVVVTRPSRRRSRCRRRRRCGCRRRCGGRGGLHAGQLRREVS